MNDNTRKEFEPAFILERADFSAILTALAKMGYDVIAPVLRDQAIVYDSVTSDTDLPMGWTDRQDAGRYQTERRNDKALFGYAVGPHSWKKYLHPPERLLWRAIKTETGLSVERETANPPKRAFLGVRACEIEAIAIQDRVFLNGAYKNTDYEARRESALIIAVNCGAPASTCFCASMNTGPAAKDGYDIAMTEVVSADAHYFVINAKTPAGEAIVKQLPLRPAAEKELKAANAVTEGATNAMTRSLETEGLQAFLQDNPNHPRWDDVAGRCLSCTNCTAVCPTCFCTTVEDHTDLTGAIAERVQRWNSCFTSEFSELSGGPVRQSTKARYRQWMTHKLSTWIDQFDTSGCVGCGRCIAWCPAGIDITEEARAMRKTGKDES